MVVGEVVAVVIFHELGISHVWICAIYGKWVMLVTERPGFRQLPNGKVAVVGQKRVRNTLWWMNPRYVRTGTS